MSSPGNRYIGGATARLAAASFGGRGTNTNAATTIGHNFGKAEKIGRMEREDAYTMKALRRTAIALVAFAVVLVVLDLSSADRPTIADRVATTIATR